MFYEAYIFWKSVGSTLDFFGFTVLAPVGLAFANPKVLSGLIVTDFFGDFDTLNEGDRFFFSGPLVRAFLI